MNLTKANFVLAVAAAVLAVPTWLTIRSEATTFVDVAAVPRLFEGFTPDLVAALLLAEPKKEQPAPPPNADPNQKPQIQYDQIAFQRADKGFLLQNMGELSGAPANRELLEMQVWKHLGEIRADKDALVQPDATDEQLASYGLDAAQAFVVKAINREQQVIAELLVGKDTASGKATADAVRGVFVRRADSRDVVLYEVPFWQRSLKAETWLDRAVLKAPGDKVRRLSVRNQTGEVVFQRAKGTASWTCDKPPEGKAAVRQMEVEGLVQRCAFVAAAQFVRPLASATLNAWGLDPSRVEVQVTYERDDQDVVAVLGIGAPLEGKNECYLRSSDSPFVMTIAAHLAAPFERDLGELFDPAAPAGDGKDGAAHPGGEAPQPGKEPAKESGVAPGPEAKDPAKEPAKDAPKDGEAPTAPAPPAPTPAGTPGGTIPAPGDGSRPEAGGAPAVPAPANPGQPGGGSPGGTPPGGGGER